MKTVIIDNSLCSYTLHDNANPEHIYKYIEALAAAGVRYVELDFRTVMKVNELPDSVGYIFRLVDPMFSELAEVFDFNYVLITFADLKRNIKAKIPVMLELPAPFTPPPKLLGYVSSQIEGTVSALRFRGSYPLWNAEKMCETVRELKNSVAVPIDMCPLNGKRTALDSAVKFSIAGADSLTLTMGMTEKYASLEEYVFTLMSVYDTLPREFDLSALCRAAVYHRYIFRNGVNGIPRVMDILDSDIRSLKNADTGESVRMRVTLKDTQYLQRQFVSALEKMAGEEGMPLDVFEDISTAIKRFDANIFNERLLSRKRSGLLN